MPVFHSGRSSAAFSRSKAGWASIFLLNIPIGIVVTVLTLMYIRGEWAEPAGQQFDVAGTLLYSMMLIGALYGLTLLPTPAGIAWMAAGAVLAYAFYRRERAAPHPMLDLSLFRNNTAFILSNIAAMINYSIVFAVGFLLSLYLQYNRGFDPQTTGVILVTMPIVQMVVSPRCRVLFRPYRAPGPRNRRDGMHHRRSRDDGAPLT